MNSGKTWERRLAARRALAGAALWFERVWPALWPPLGIVGLFVCLALLGVSRLLPPSGQVALLVCAGLAVALLLLRGFAGLRAPTRSAVDRRLERASGLSHRPLAALSDQPTPGDAMAMALWRAHVARAAAQLRRLRVGPPRPGLPRRDPRALRLGLIVALVACTGVAGADAPARLGAALHPTLPRGSSGPATELQAWVTPPAYTALAPMFLRADTPTVSVPAGSRLTLSVTGGSATPRLDWGGRAADFRALDAASFQAEQVLSENGRITVRRDGATLGRWDVAVIPDHPPVAEWSAPPGVGRARLHTRLPWHASDDYGVTNLSAELRLRARPATPPLVIALPLPGAAKDAHGIAEQDLSADPRAGLPVIARLVAKDALGQTGASADAPFTLPERSFRNKEARALIAVRKSLTLNPDDRTGALGGLDALLVEPGSIGNDPGAYLNLSAIYYLLEFDRGDVIADAQARLWALALQLEEGAAARTDRALQEAREAARAALDKLRAEPSEANRAELEKKLQALSEAIRQHMQALAEQFRRQMTSAPPDAARRLSAKDLARMAERARQSAAKGETEQAAREMAELDRLLDALRDAKPMTEADRARAAQRQKGRSQMSALQDMLGRQGGLLDRAQDRAREAARAGAEQAPSTPGCGGAKAGSGGAAGATSSAGGSDAATGRSDRQGAGQPGRGGPRHGGGRKGTGGRARQRRTGGGAEGDRGVAEGRPRGRSADGRQIRPGPAGRRRLRAGRGRGHGLLGRRRQRAGRRPRRQRGRQLPGRTAGARARSARPADGTGRAGSG